MNEKETLQTKNAESKSSYFIIYDWMIQELHLKGSELLIYAIIYSYCSANGTPFDGSLSYLSQRSGIAKQNVQIALKKLISLKLINKAINQVKGLCLPTYEVCTKRVCYARNVYAIHEACTNNKVFKKEEIELYKYNSLSKKESEEREQNVPPSLNGNDTETDTKPKRQTFDDILDDWVSKNIQEPRRREVKSLLVEWLKVRKASKVTTTNKSLNLNLDKLISSSEQSSLNLIEYLKEVIRRGYSSFYVINQNRFTSFQPSSAPTTSTNSANSSTPDNDLGIEEVTLEDIQAIKDQFGFS